MKNERIGWRSRGRRWGAAAGWAAAGVALLWLEPALAKSAGELGEMWAGYGEPLGRAVSALCYPAGMAAGQLKVPLVLLATGVKVAAL